MKLEVSNLLESYQINHVDFSARFKPIRKEKDFHLGEFYLMKDKDTKRRVIVKSESFENQDELENIIQGINALLVLNDCPSIVRFLGYSIKGKSINLIYENHESTLQESLKGANNRTFSDKSLMAFISNMIESLACLQSLNLNHMDLKTSNVLEQNKESLNNCYKLFFTHYITNSVLQIKQLQVPIQNYFLSSFQLDQLNMNNIELSFEDRIHSDIQSLGLMTLWLGSPTTKQKYYQYNEQDELQINQEVIAKRMKQFRKTYSKKTVKLLEILLGGQQDTFNDILAVINQNANKSKKHIVVTQQDEERQKSGEKFHRSQRQKSNEKSHNRSIRQVKPEEQSINQSEPSFRRKNYLSNLEEIERKIIYRPGTKQLYPYMQQKQYNDGSYYVGQVSSSKQREGKGIYYYSEGDVYAGDWRDNALQGYGIYLFSNGQKYEGGVQKGIKLGKGEYIYSNGNRYEGQWSNDKKHGFGVYTYQSKGEKYEGQFKNGLKQGVGSYFYANGDIYQGSFHHGDKSGNGVARYHNGNKLSGVWQAGQLNGSASVEFNNGDKLTADFIKGKKEGRGNYIYQNLTQFQGKYDNNKKSGPCAIKYQNGDTYQGNLQNGKRNGLGLYYYSNGMSYNGQWKQNLRHGNGEFRLQNGVTVAGTWNMSSLLNPCKIQYTNGDVYEGETDQLIIKQGEGSYTFRSGQKLQGQFKNNNLSKGIFIDLIGNQSFI